MTTVTPATTPQITGIILINLGTPDAATIPAVHRYLREFLSDPYVIDIPAPARWLLVNTVILPFRTRQSTHAYQQIWTSQGSPLRFHTKALTAALQQQLKLPHYLITDAMRYGQPSIETAVTELLSQQVTKILIVPLYPQYAESTTRSSLEKTRQLIRQQHPQIPIKTIPHFYADPGYINSTARLIKTTLGGKHIDTLIFSYHGLPERHIHRVCQQSGCNIKKCCPAIDNNNRLCYRAQCYDHSRRLAQALGLPANAYRVAFQSRLGKTPWITPYTDITLEALAKENIKNIAIACPSFICDCLETLEEIGIRERHRWQTLGGKQFIRIPCLNAETYWVKALATLITSTGFPNKNHS